MYSPSLSTLLSIDSHPFVEIQSNMAPERFEPSAIKNKIKREEIARKAKRTKRQAKLQKRLARAKEEESDPLAKKVSLHTLSRIAWLNSMQKRLAQNIPRTLDNTREYDPSFLTAQPSSAPDLSPTAGPSSEAAPNDQQPVDESAMDIASDPFASYFDSAFGFDPSVPPKVLITTSFKASKITYDFCDELVSVIPGSEFVRRKKGKGFEMGRIAAWAAGRGYSNMIVVNEDMKKPSESQANLSVLYTRQLNKPQMRSLSYTFQRAHRYTSSSLPYN